MNCRYHITIAEIQGTKWFGSDVWPADKSWVFLHSARPLAYSDEFAQCVKGVGILLNPCGVGAWHAAGYSWCVVSSM